MPNRHWLGQPGESTDSGRRCYLKAMYMAEFNMPHAPNGYWQGYDSATVVDMFIINVAVLGFIS
jgi:hypothetical protein